jgi:hypothetical protein
MAAVELQHRLNGRICENPDQRVMAGCTQWHMRRIAAIEKFRLRRTSAPGGAAIIHPSARLTQPLTPLELITNIAAPATVLPATTSEATNIECN